MIDAEALPSAVMPSSKKRFSSGDGGDERADAVGGGDAGGGQEAAAGDRVVEWGPGAGAREREARIRGARRGEHVDRGVGDLHGDGPDRDLYIYSRHFNPTVLNLGRQMAAMEGTDAAYCMASGMSAISSVFLQVCGAGDHVVASRRLYGGTHALLAHFLPRACGIQTTFVDIDDLAAVAAAIREVETKVLYLETVANPSLAVADVPGLCAVAREKGVMVVVDNTFIIIFDSMELPRSSPMRIHLGFWQRIWGRGGRPPEATQVKSNPSGHWFPTDVVVLQQF